MYQLQGLNVRGRRSILNSSQSSRFAACPQWAVGMRLGMGETASMPPCALIWIWVTVTSGRHPMPARGCFMFRRFFKFFLAAICIASLAPLAMACGGQEGPTPTPFTGDWVLEDETDPITDEGFISIWLEASDDNATSGNHKLVVQCHDGHLFDVYVIWMESLVATSESVNVAWRADDDDPQRSTWFLKEERYTFAPSYGPLSRRYDTSEVRDLRKADKISVRVHTIAGRKQPTAVFRTAGFEDAFEPIKRACGAS